MTATVTRLADHAELRRKRLCEAWLERVRRNVPERRAVVPYDRGIVWRQDGAVLAEALAEKARREFEGTALAIVEDGRHARD